MVHLYRLEFGLEIFGEYQCEFGNDENQPPQINSIVFIHISFIIIFQSCEGFVRHTHHHRQASEFCAIFLFCCFFLVCRQCTIIFEWLVWTILFHVMHTHNDDDNWRYYDIPFSSYSRLWHRNSNKQTNKTITMENIVMLLLFHKYIISTI